MNFFKTLFLSEEEKIIRDLVKHAASTNILSDRDVDILNSNVDFLAVSSDSQDYENDLPEIPLDPYKKFRMIYTLEEQLIKEGTISERRVSIMTKLFSYLKIKRERLIELVEYLKINILNGNQLDEAYERLGYLLKPSNY
ncbi:MAG: hypothetical protein ABJG41_18760 [Cyclobacteriaceae bacterium]